MKRSCMRRVNFTLDEEVIQLLETLAANYYHGNRSLAVRSALESLAAHLGHDGWVITGYTPVVLDTAASCHSCGDPHQTGEVLFRPVFQRGAGRSALTSIPAENWLDCSQCVQHLAVQ